MNGKEDVVHIYNRILAIKKEQNHAICNDMDGLETVILSEIRWISYDIAYMWNLKEMVQMNLFTKQK